MPRVPCYVSNWIQAGLFSGSLTVQWHILSPGPLAHSVLLYNISLAKYWPVNVRDTFAAVHFLLPFPWLQAGLIFGFRLSQMESQCPPHCDRVTRPGSA